MYGAVAGGAIHIGRDVAFSKDISAAATLIRIIVDLQIGLWLGDVGNGNDGIT